MVMYENENLGTRLDNIEQIFVNDEVIPQILKRAGSARTSKGKGKGGSGEEDTLVTNLEKIQAELTRGPNRPPERGGDSASASRLGTRE